MMKRTWLVQRLTPPFGEAGQFGLMLETFAFGGGLRNGGLSTEAMGLLRGIFSFDYMGAAEFEFGAVPEALNGLALDRGLLVAGSLTIARTEVLYLCREQHVGGVTERIWGMAAGEVRLKAPTRFSAALTDGKSAGWLELNNGFFFFTDREMWTKTCALFGVAPTDEEQP